MRSEIIDAINRSALPIIWSAASIAEERLTNHPPKEIPKEITLDRLDHDIVRNPGTDGVSRRNCLLIHRVG